MITNLSLCIWSPENSLNMVLAAVFCYIRIHWLIPPPDVNVLILVTRESSGFYSVQSTLEYKVMKEDKDARFSCEVSFFVPAAVRTVESNSINITVHCEFTLFSILLSCSSGRCSDLINCWCFYHISCWPSSYQNVGNTVAVKLFHLLDIDFDLFSKVFPSLWCQVGHKQSWTHFLGSNYLYSFKCSY